MVSPSALAPRRVETPRVEAKECWLAERLGRHRWWLTRLLALPFHVLIFAVATFFLVRAIPGNPVLDVTGGHATPAQAATVRRNLGLDGSMLAQLGRFLDDLVHFDLGTSFVTHRPVLSDIGQLFPATLELTIFAFVAVAIFTGWSSYQVVMHPRRPWSRAFALLAHTAGAIPDFVLGVVAIFVFYAELHWAPAPTGLLSATLNTPAPVTHFPYLDAIIGGNLHIVLSETAHLALPIVVLTLAISPVLMRQLIGAMEESVGSTATRFRIASGARRRTVIASVYRRALPPVVAMSGMIFGQLLGGAVIVEQLFGLPGIGQYAVSAVGAKDFPALQGFLIVVAAATLAVFFLVDIVNMMLDPRRKPGVQAAP